MTTSLLSCSIYINSGSSLCYLCYLFLSKFLRDIALQGRWPDVLDYLVEQFKLPRKCVS